MIFYFLRANHGNICTAKMTSKPVNLGDGKGMQISCTFNVSGQEIYINILKGGCGKGVYHVNTSKKMAEMSKMSKKKLKCQHIRGNVNETQ